jgi:hypothetical protein
MGNRLHRPEQASGNMHPCRLRACRRPGRYRSGRIDDPDSMIGIRMGTASSTSYSAGLAAQDRKT